MYRSLVFLVIIALSSTKISCLDEPDEEKVAQFKNLVAEWSVEASRMIRSLKVAPAEEAARVSDELQDALSEAKRSKRSADGEDKTNEGIQNILANVNEGIKSLISNVTKSDVYQQFQKFGEGLGEKGKGFIEKLEQQVKNFTQQAN